jgi:LPS export ABC transporter protein LptC
MGWQKRARFGVAVFGIAAAVGVYTAIGERRVTTPAPPPPRIDPKAVIESSGAVVRQVRGTKLDYVINADRVLTYESGAARLMGVEIRVRGRAGRDFLITGREAQAGDKKQDLLLSGSVVLSANDGLRVTTERAVFSEIDGIVRATGAVEFEKGKMSGSGVGMTYDNNRDLLSIADQSRVKLLDEQENPQMEFSAGLSTLSRPDDYLMLEGTVHGRNGEEVFDAERATARLTEDEERVTLIELRGKAEVRGGSSLESMSANDIDLDYMDDGETLERVVLSGRGSIEMMGWGQGQGRRILGESLELLLAPDGSMTAATGRGGVQLDLPADNKGPARVIRAKSLDATGEAGEGLTAARFTEVVEYREHGQKGEALRSATASALRVTLDGNGVGSAAFSGNALFEEQGLTAGAAEISYEPAQGRLVLKGSDAGGGPRVADEQVVISAQSIGVALGDRQMSATGNVTTVLHAHTGNARSGTAAATKFPGLLKQEQPANVHADALEYQGSVGSALYKGNATLWQGDTAIRADLIAVDRATGDLTARGAARSTLVLDDATSIGRAEGIRYEEATRTITYDNPTPPGRGVATKPVPAQLSGAEGDLSASRIEVLLQETAGGIARLEAYEGVNLHVGARRASGARLTYFAEDERYLIAASGTAPVRLIDACRETTGKTVTFFKAGERVVVDGHEEIRTQSRRGNNCAEPLPR